MKLLEIRKVIITQNPSIERNGLISSTVETVKTMQDKGRMAPLPQLKQELRDFDIVVSPSLSLPKFIALVYDNVKTIEKKLNGGDKTKPKKSKKKQALTLED